MSKLSQITSRVLAEVLVIGREIYSNYKLKRTTSPFLKNKVVVWLFWFNLIVLVVDFFYIFLKLKGREDLIPLHYNIYFGVDLIGNKEQVFKLPLIGAIVFLVNYFLAGLIYRSEKFASYILIFASLAVAIVLSLAGMFILNI